MMAEARRLMLLILLNAVIGGGMYLGFRWMDQRDKLAMVDASTAKLAPPPGSTQAKLPDRISSWPRLPSSHGDDQGIDVARWKGKPLIVNFWASWCTACAEERPQLDQLASEFSSQMLGVATQDSLEQVRESEAKRQHHYPIVVDTDGKWAYELGVDVLPETLVIDGEGRIIRRLRGVLTPIQTEAVRLALRGIRPL
jgi:thiol-disulfide isomerase/thioredoxin